MNDATRRRIRTTFQTVVGVAPVLLVVVPVALEYAEVALPARAYGVLAGAAAVIVAIASYVTKVMNNPVVAGFIERQLPWLAAADPEATDEGAVLDDPVEDVTAATGQIVE